MKRFLIHCFVFCAFSTTHVAAQMVLLKGDYADPTVLKDGDDYYMTHSPFHYQPGFLIWHSRDLINWRPICRAGSSWEGSAWAPDLQKVGDTYYIYFPANGTNWVMTAKDIRGPWTEPIDLKIRGIDPGLLVTPDGKRYLFTTVGEYTPLTNDGLARAGETIKVYDGWRYPQEWETECTCLESPKMTYHNGYIYMTSAEGGTAGPATSHMSVCARAKSVNGPWENSPYNPIVHTYSAEEQWWSKGHGSIVEGPDGQWWIIYHAYNRDAYWLGRYTLMEPIEWTKNGWYRPVKDMPLPKTGKLPTLSDDFELSNIGWQWTGWKEDITRIASIKKGSLTMKGRGTSPKDGRLVLITPTDTCFTIETDIVLGRKNVQAGLLLFYSEKAFAGITSDGKTFTIYKDATQTESAPNHFGRRFRLRIDNHSGKLTIKVSQDGKEWQTITDNIDASGFHQNNYYDFLALRPALCTMGNGEAQFRQFIYKTK